MIDNIISVDVLFLMVSLISTIVCEIIDISMIPNVNDHLDDANLISIIIFLRLTRFFVINRITLDTRATSI